MRLCVQLYLHCYRFCASIIYRIITLLWLEYYWEAWGNVPVWFIAPFEDGSRIIHCPFLRRKYDSLPPFFSTLWFAYLDKLNRYCYISCKLPSDFASHDDYVYVVSEMIVWSSLFIGCRVAGIVEAPGNFVEMLKPYRFQTVILNLTLWGSRSNLFPYPRVIRPLLDH